MDLVLIFMLDFGIDTKLVSVSQKEKGDMGGHTYKGTGILEKVVSLREKQNDIRRHIKGLAYLKK